MVGFSNSTAYSATAARRSASVEAAKAANVMPKWFNRNQSNEHAADGFPGGRLLGHADDGAPSGVTTIMVSRSGPSSVHQLGLGGAIVSVRTSAGGCSSDAVAAAPAVHYTVAFPEDSSKHELKRDQFELVEHRGAEQDAGEAVHSRPRKRAKTSAC